ncbi:NADH-quinone oxidoreductase subunit A [Streptomyces sp. PKU-MA01144]|nr:NADH-quinone oxidoreductase subunit A [Streptomyces sp. PKU-MA01144]
MMFLSVRGLAVREPFRWAKRRGLCAFEVRDRWLGSMARVSVWLPVLVLLGLTVAAVAGLYGLSALLAERAAALAPMPFAGGLMPREHAFSRFHVRWYPVTMIFLAFDMEMLFMYPWVRVVREMGPPAVVEMFLFLGILFAAVTYAWREGALRWA